MSRRKQSNPKPLKAGDEDNWNEEEDKSGMKMTTTTLEESSSSSKDATDCDENIVSPAPRPPPSSSPMSSCTSEDTKPIKIEPEPESDYSSERGDVCESVIKRVPASETESKPVVVLTIKNEPIASPVSNAVSLVDQEYSLTAPQVLQSALTGARYYSAVINMTSESCYSSRPETLDTRQGFLCPPCGIRFSSLSTLEAHQTYYCSHRQKKISKGGAESEGEDGRSVSVSGGYDLDDGSSGENMSSAEPCAKNAKTGKQYRCTHCSYSADKKVSLNRHMRMHSVSPATSMQNDSDSSMPPVDRYCQECDIRFSNLKTFRAHKLHYCSTRNVIKRASNINSSSSPNLPVDSRVTPPLSFSLSNQGPLQPFVALPTNPVLIVPYSLIQAGSILSGPVTSGLSIQDGVYLLLPDGSIQMVTQGIASNQMTRVPETRSSVLQPLSTVNSNQSRKENNVSPNNVKLPSIPTLNNGALDLRMRRESNGSESTTTTSTATAVDPSEEEKENRLVDIKTDHEDIVCAPSIPLILSSSACSTPSPVPLSPESQFGTSAKLDIQCSPSPKSVITMSSSKPCRKLTNGVIQKGTKQVDVEDKKTENHVHQSGPTSGLEHANANFNLTEMLLAVASQNQESAKEIQFSPEMIPHLAAIQQMGSTKRPALNPIANIPLLLPPVSPGSRVIPDLLSPSILPLLTSELAMRLVTSNVPPGVPQYVRQGTWKCEDCNIGFCKYENYVAHKKHYCSTRKVQELVKSDDSIKTSPIGSPSSKAAVSPQTLSKENTSPMPHPQSQPQQQSQLPPSIQNSRPFSQFVCSMCGIKFTSLDNLTTHQTFYCPNRIVISEGEKSSLKCPKCKALLPADQLPAHQCTGVTNTGWKCPCCFIVCNSTNAIQKHFESHTGVKAFLCTICNYKGNTIRGMRTHIRVHFDKRNGEVTEENYISCIMEDASSTVSSADENSTDKSLKKSSSIEQAANVAPPPTENNSEKCVVTETRTSPVPSVVNCIEDEDEYIEVDELPNIKSELQFKSDVDSESASKIDCESPQDTGDDLSVYNKKFGSKYCKSCDISFNYLSTFIAHKKYYCPNNQSDASSALNAAESIIVPTNMATAAHIV